MTTEGNAWLYKNKDHGMMSAAASLGSILLWNVEEGLTQVCVCILLLIIYWGDGFCFAP